MALGGTNLDKNPGGGVQGTSYLYDYGTSPNTRTAVSQKVRVLTPTYGETTSMHQMGVVSNFAPSISRTVDELRGIGFGDQDSRDIGWVARYRRTSRAHVRHGIVGASIFVQQCSLLWGFS